MIDAVPQNKPGWIAILCAYPKQWICGLVGVRGSAALVKLVLAGLRSGDHRIRVLRIIVGRDRQEPRPNRRRAED